MAGKDNKFLLKQRFGLKARISLYERVVAFLQADIDIVSTLQAIRNRYRERKDYRAKVIDSWISEIERGGSFSDALREWVPPSEHMLISAGDRGEGLITGLQQATIMSNAAARSKGAIIGGLIFPVVLFGMIMLLMVMFQSKMVPIFEQLMPVPQWPLSARVLYNVSYFIKHYLWLVILAMAGLAFLVTSTLGTWTRPPREIFDKLAPWSIYRTYQGSSFLIGLSSLMKAGVAAYEALAMMHANASPWMRMHLERMMSAMKLGGSSDGKALNTGLLDRETAGDVEDYSRLGSFQDALELMGSRSLEAGVKSIETKMGVIRVLMLMLVAMCIGWVYLTTYMLQSSIAQNLSNQR